MRGKHQFRHDPEDAKEGQSNLKHDRSRIQMANPEFLVKSVPVRIQSQLLPIPYEEVLDERDGFPVDIGDHSTPSRSPP